MANAVLTVDKIAQEALAVLENELGVIKTLHRAYEDEYTDKVNGYMPGSTIRIRRPADFTVRTGAVASAQDVVEGNVNLVIDTQKGVDFSFTSQEMSLNIEDFSERILQPAMTNLINDVCNDVLTEMYRSLWSWVGTPGTRITTFNGFSKAPERLDEQSVPQASRGAALCPNDWWGVIGGQTTLYNPNLVADAYKTGSLGNVGGCDTYMSQVVPTHTVGPLGGTPLVNGASQNVTYASTKTTIPWGQALVTDGWTAAAASRVKRGDVFTLASVFMVNNKTKQSTGILQQFVCTTDGSSDGSGNLTLSIAPPIITSGPHQTVNAAPADNAALTFLGTASTAYRQNMAYHKNTMALAFVPMIIPAGAVDVSRRSYKGMSVRMIPTYDGLNDVSNYRLDLLYGKKILDARLGTRLSGT